MKEHRLDIDGLRALAVLGVILFHAGFGFPGGFVGVDIFFVISGYLITQIIVRESEEGRFSFKNFWMRRIRRIMPAAIFMALCVLAMGWLVLDPKAFEKLGHSAVANALMSSNFYFWKSPGYFADASILKPLLHTWSLAVEEQFYFFHPFLVVILFRLFHKRMNFGFVVIFASSLLFSIWAVRTHPHTAFFLLPSRAWELTAGAIAAVTTLKAGSRTQADAFAFAGLFLMMAPMFLYSGATPFPGMAAVPPVLGAALFLWSNQQYQTMAGKWLSVRPLVLTGLASYSLYLWHWPALAFTNHLLIEVTPAAKLVALMIAAAAAFASWKWIENPIRKAPFLMKPLPCYSFGAGVTIAMTIAALLIWKAHGLPARFDPSEAVLTKDVEWDGQEYESDRPNGIAIGASNVPPTFVLWGDSHGMVLIPTISQLATANHIGGAALVSPAVPPVTGLWKPAKGVSKSKILRINKKRFEWIMSSGIRNVFLVGRWRGMIDGMLPTEIDIGSGIDKKWSMVVDSAVEADPNTSAAALQRQLAQMIKRFDQRGISTWLLMQVPCASRASVAKSFYLRKKYPLLNAFDFANDTFREKFEHDRKRTQKLFATLDFESLHIVDPAAAFFNSGQRVILYGDRAYYRDEDHLTQAGVEHYLRSTLETVVAQIATQN